MRRSNSTVWSLCRRCGIDYTRRLVVNNPVTKVLCRDCRLIVPKHEQAGYVLPVAA